MTSRPCAFAPSRLVSQWLSFVRPCVALIMTHCITVCLSDAQSMFSWWGDTSIVTSQVVAGVKGNGFSLCGFDRYEWPEMILRREAPGLHEEFHTARSWAASRYSGTRR